MDGEKITLWKQRLLSFHSSGLSVNRWCKENHISSPTFYYWRARLENEAKEITPKIEEQTVFVEVNQSIKKSVITTATRVHISWNELHFEISSKEEADLVNYFIHQMQSSC